MERKGKNRGATAFHQMRELSNEFQTLKNKGLMRTRNFVFIAATATMLASCSNDLFQNDYQEEPAVIGFTSYSESGTRGDITKQYNLEFYHNTFAVYGTKVNKKDPTKLQYVFGGKPISTSLAPEGDTCTYQTTPDAILEDWKYNGLRFWDKQANYNFIAYAPVSDANPIRYYYAAEDSLVGAIGNEFKTKEPYVLAGTNLQATATDTVIIKGFTAENEGDLDLMISTPNPQNGATHSDYVNLVFRHILSKINVSVAKSEALQGCTVTIKSITISGLDDKGEYYESNYDNTSDSKVSGWATSKSAEYDYNLTYTGTQVLRDGETTGTPAVFKPGKPYYFIESLVLPQSIDALDQVKLTMDYTIKSGNYSEDYPYELDFYEIAKLQNIYEGYNYTLNFTIDPDVIKFDATVAAWSDETINKTIGKED